MSHQVEPFEFSDATTSLRRVWRVENPRGRIVMVHGIISHSGWYIASCDALAAAGFEVHFLDRRGSGLNEEARGDIASHEIWIDDVVEFLKSLPTDRPRLVVGMSWGGKLVVELAKRHPTLIDAMALVCPGVYAKQFPPAWKYALLRGLAKIGLGSVRVPIPLRDPALFTDVPNWQKYIAGDPKTLRRVTIRFALADGELTRLARLDHDLVTVPTWMVLAGRDRICDNEALRRMLTSFQNEQKSLTCYEQAAHTFEFEPDPSTYFADLVKWASANTPPSRSS